MATYDNVVYKRFNGSTWDIFNFSTTAESVVGLPALLNTKANDNEVVKLTGAQTIAGVKTFTSIPVLPTSNPTSANQAVRKSYVDTTVANKTVSYAQITGSKPPVNATANTGTVTNVSAGTQINGMTMLISNATSTPTIATSITNPAQFRTAIGAGTGTSNLTIGTTASTAKAGNYQPTIAQVTGLTAALQDAGRVKLLRARSDTTALTAYNHATVTGVGSQLERGDTIMFEVHTAATITSATPKILTATVSSTANSTSEARSVTFTTWTGSIMKVYSLSVARTSAGLLNFSSMNVMTMSKSSSNMNIINSSWTAYIGRIWKVDGSVI